MIDHSRPESIEGQEQFTPESANQQDFFKDFESHISGHTQSFANDPQPIEAKVTKTTVLEILLEREAQLNASANNEIVFTPPLITRDDVGIVWRNTINVIQGHMGSHKSRFAETMAALLLKKMDCRQDYLGFVRHMMELFTVLYIDTERTVDEEFPYAIQSVRKKAGYGFNEPCPNFRFTSIKGIERRDRLKAIETFIKEVRKQSPYHLFVLLDVVTDCVGSFNDDEQAMKLFDFIGNLCDEHNATFLLVIHQNPGTEKARGHTGTEAGNKASTLIQIGFEQVNNVDTDLIRLRFIKLRRAKRPEPLYIKYSEEAKGLVIADAAQISAHINSRKQKAESDDVVDRLASLLSDGPMPKGEVIKILESEFGAKNSTIRNRIRDIKTKVPEMYNDEGKSVRLAEYKEGRGEFFRLEPLASIDSVNC